MKVKIQVFDDHVQELIDRLDKEARKQDKGKYGMKRDENIFSQLVYDWLYRQDKRAERENIFPS